MIDSVLIIAAHTDSYRPDNISMWKAKKIAAGFDILRIIFKLSLF